MKPVSSQGKSSKKEGKVKSGRDLVTVNGHYTPEGLTYKGKEIRPGIFVNITGKDEREKEELFEKAKQEIGKEAENLPLYEVIDV